MNGSKSSTIVRWKDKYKSPRLVWVVAISMLAFGIFSLSFAFLGFLGIFGAIPNPVSWLVNLPLSFALLICSGLLILHFLSFLTRKQNQLQFNKNDVVFKPAHVDYSRFFDGGWHAVASDNWGLNRGLLTYRIPIHAVSFLKLEEQTIILALRGEELRIEKPEFNCLLEDALERLRDL